MRMFEVNKVQDKVGPLEGSDGNNNRGILNGRKPK